MSLHFLHFAGALHLPDRIMNTSYVYPRPSPVCSNADLLHPLVKSSFLQFPACQNIGRRPTGTNLKQTATNAKPVRKGSGLLPFLHQHLRKDCKSRGSRMKRSVAGSMACRHIEVTWCGKDSSLQIQTLKRRIFTKTIHAPPF